MKSTLILALVLMLLTIGCGVNKQYVADEVSASEARTNAEVNDLKAKADANGAEIQRLQQLSQELSTKADQALNKASGFENYQIIWSGEINFAFDSFNIDDVAASILDEAGQKMEEVPSALLELAGYCDRTGTKKYNLTLGFQRADAAERYLADKFGVPLYRMYTISFGKEKPIAMPDEQNAAAKNRRVHLSIWGPM
jgi:outer membrane protein OmpA-like peptidoglycan-associated protein